MPTPAPRLGPSGLRASPDGGEAAGHERPLFAARAAGLDPLQSFGAGLVQRPLKHELRSLPSRRYAYAAWLRESSRSQLDTPHNLCRVKTLCLTPPAGGGRRGWSACRPPQVRFIAKPGSNAVGRTGATTPSTRRSRAGMARAALQHLDDVNLGIANRRLRSLPVELPSGRSKGDRQPDQEPQGHARILVFPPSIGCTCGPPTRWSRPSPAPGHRRANTQEELPVAHTCS